MSNLRQEAYIPKITENIFYLFLPKELREHLIGDLQEEFYQEIVPKYGLSKAKWWYRKQVFKSIRFYILNRKGDIMFFLVSIFLFLVLSIMAALLEKSQGVHFNWVLGYFVNFPSLILVIIPSFIFAVAATSIKAWKLGVKLLLKDQDYSEQKQIKEASRFLKVFGNMSIALGIFYTLFGRVQLLGESPGNFSSSFSILSTCTIYQLTLLYGIAIKCILYVADQRLRNRFLNGD